MNKRKRFITGFLSSVATHISIAVVLGLLGLFPLPVWPSDSFDLVFIGNEGGRPMAVAMPAPEEIEEIKQEITPEDITERRIVQERRPVRRIERITAAGAKTTISDKVTGSSDEGQSTDAGTDTGQGKETGNAAGGGGGVPRVMPRLLNYRDPEYPFAGIRNQIECIVHIQVLVTVGGAAQNPVVVKSSGRRDFDQSALKSAGSWRFSPAKDSKGSNIPFTVIVPVNFQLRNRK